MSSVIYINSQKAGNHRCDIRGCADAGRHQPVRDEDDRVISCCVRCPTCLQEFGVRNDIGMHVMGQCEPEIDMDTRWQLLALFANLVRHHNRTSDPEAAALVEQLGKIIERHEPGEGGGE